MPNNKNIQKHPIINNHVTRFMFKNIIDISNIDINVNINENDYSTFDLELLPAYDTLIAYIKQTEDYYSTIFGRKHKLFPYIHQCIPFPTFIGFESSKESIKKIIKALPKSLSSTQKRELMDASETNYFTFKLYESIQFEFLNIIQEKNICENHSIIFFSMDGLLPISMLKYLNRNLIDYNHEKIKLFRPYDYSKQQLGIAPVDYDFLINAHINITDMKLFGENINDFVSEQEIPHSKYIIIDFNICITGLHFERVNYSFKTIFVLLYISLLRLKKEGSIILITPFFGKKYVFDLFNEISAMFESVEIKLNFTATHQPNRIFHYIIMNKYTG